MELMLSMDKYTLKAFDHVNDKWDIITNFSNEITFRDLLGLIHLFYESNNNGNKKRYGNFRIFEKNSNIPCEFRYNLHISNRKKS